MSTKVKALTTLCGEYGTAYAGDILELRDQTAKELQEKGSVEIITKTKTGDVYLKPRNLTHPGLSRTSSVTTKMSPGDL